MQWHDCPLVGKAAESNSTTDIHKGTQVFVAGKQQHRKYERTVCKEKLEWPVTEIVMFEENWQNGEGRICQQRAVRL